MRLTILPPGRRYSRCPPGRPPVPDRSGVSLIPSGTTCPAVVCLNLALRTRGPLIRTKKPTLSARCCISACLPTGPLGLSTTCKTLEPKAELAIRMRMGVPAWAGSLKPPKPVNCSRREVATKSETSFGGSVIQTRFVDDWPLANVLLQTSGGKPRGVAVLVDVTLRSVSSSWGVYATASWSSFRGPIEPKVAADHPSGNSVGAIG